MFANHKGEIPFVVLLLPFIAGIEWALYQPYITTASILFISLLCLSAVYVVLNIWYLKLRVYKAQWLGGLLIHVLLFCSGWLCAVNNNELNKDNHFSKAKARYLTIRICNEPVVKNGSVRFVAAVMECIDSNARDIVAGKLLVSIKDSAAFKLKYGDVLLITANYTTVDPPYNPAEFNYKQYLAHQNIYQQAFLYPRQYVLEANNAGNTIISYSLQLRQLLVAKFNTHMRDSSAIAVASTMILGYKADLSDDLLQAYSKTGTLHVLSVSGAHVAIVFFLLNGALSFLNKIKHGKAIKALIIIALIWAYALLTGFSPAVNRAALMISLIIGGNSFYRHINPLNLLAVSAFALLLYNPYYLTDVGFQLSYLAVVGLIVFQPVIYQRFSFKNKWVHKLWSLCSVSIAAQLITFPLSAYYFHQFPVYFLLSNLFILLPVIAIMYTGLAFLLFWWWPGVSSALAYLLEKSIVLMNKGLIIIEHLPYAGINKLWISRIDYLAMYGVIILMMYFLHTKNRRLLNIGLLLLFTVTASIAWKKMDAGSTRSITFINLKKQRAIVFKNGSDAVVLSDLTPDEKSYRYSIQPGLDSAKVENVTVYSFADKIDRPYLKKRGNFIQFQNKSLVLLDSSSKASDALRPLKVDYVYITRNSSAAIKGINQNLNPRLVVIGADNSDRYVDDLQKHLLSCQRRYYLLKRNRALNLKYN